MSILTVVVSRQVIEQSFMTGFSINKTVVSKGMPDDAQLLNVWFDLLTDQVRLVFNCPSDAGDNRDVVVELTTLRNAR